MGRIIEVEEEVLRKTVERAARAHLGRQDGYLARWIASLVVVRLANQRPPSPPQTITPDLPPGLDENDVPN